MRKIILICINILSIFILCSLSYQPIIADTQIEEINQVMEYKTSISNMDRLREVYNRVLTDIKPDCGCSPETNDYYFTIICWSLVGVLAVLLFLVEFPNLNEGKIKSLINIIRIITIVFDCGWVNPYDL